MYQDTFCPKCKKSNTHGVEFKTFKSCINCLEKIIDEYQFFVNKFGSYEEVVDSEKEIICSCLNDVLFYEGCQCGALKKETERKKWRNKCLI